MLSTKKRHEAVQRKALKVTRYDMEKRCGKKRFLVVLTGLHACSAFLILCFSVATDFWLFTYERQYFKNETTPSNIITMHSGLWRKCYEIRAMPSLNEKTQWSEDMITHSGRQDKCVYIRYFQSKMPEGDNPTELVLHEMQPATYFTLTGLIVLMLGCIVSFVSFCQTTAFILDFISGACYVLSGLSVLVGIVFYVGSTSQTFDSNAKSLEGDHKYIYQYGPSFYQTLFSFILTEFAGVYAVYLYISKNRHKIKVDRKEAASLLSSSNNAHCSSTSGIIGLRPAHIVSGYNNFAQQANPCSTIPIDGAKQARATLGARTALSQEDAGNNTLNGGQHGFGASQQQKSEWISPSQCRCTTSASSFPTQNQSQSYQHHTENQGSIVVTRDATLTVANEFGRSRTTPV